MPELEVLPGPENRERPPAMPGQDAVEPQKQTESYGAESGKPRTYNRVLENRLTSCAVAVVLALSAFFVRDALLEINSNIPPLLPFGLAILIATLLADVWAGILVTLISAVGAIYFPVLPKTLTPFTKRPDAVEWIVLFAIGCFLSFVVEIYHRNREKLELYRLQEARSESNECYRFLFSSMNDAFFMADILLDSSGKPIDYQIVEANHAMEVQYGVPHEKIIGNTALALDPGLDPIWIEAFGRVALTGEQVRSNRLLSFKNSQFEVSIYQIRKGRFAAILRDITERRRSEDLLRVSRAKLEAALSSLADAVLITDADGVYVDYNEAFATICRFKNKEECSKSLAEIRNLIEAIDANGEPVPLEEWAVPRALRGETGASVEYTMRRKDTGETWTGSYTFSPIRTPNGKIVGSVMSARDITEQKRAENILATTLQRFYLILSNLSSGVLLVKSMGRVEYANEAFCRLHGLRESPAELMAEGEGKITEKLRRAHDILDEDFLHIKEMVMKGDAVYGEEVHIRGGVTILRDFVPLMLNGKSYGNLWVLTDITARKRAEESLLASQRENKFLADMILGSTQPLGVAYPDGRLAMVNKAYEEMMGYSAEELRSINWQKALTPPEFAEVTRDSLGELLRTGVPVRFEKECIRKDGSRVPVELLSHLVKDANGEPLFFSFLTDITERQRAKEELKKLNRALKAVGRSNQALLHATREAEYLEEVCHVVRKDCGYAMVWIGEAMHDEKQSVRPIAASGTEPKFLEDMGIRWADCESGRGPIGTAIRTGKTSMCRNIFTDPQMAHCRQNAAQRGYASLLVIPLKIRGNSWGAISIYSPVTDAFSDGEVQLLTELVDDLEFGIQTLRTRTAHAQAERALRESEELLGLFVEHAPAALAMLDRQMCYLYSSKHWKTVFGLGSEELRGKSHYEVFPEISDDWKEAHRRGLAGETLRQENACFKRADGTEQWLRWEIRPWFGPEGKVGGIVIFCEDITENRRAEIALRESEQRLRELAASLLTVQEEERRSLARELHDDLTQRMASLSIELGNLAKEVPSPCADSQGRIVELQNQALRASSEMRRISHGLHPSAIVDFGLSIALEEFCEEFRRSQGVCVDFEGLIDDSRLNDIGATCLYRIAQESMRNATIHGQATRIRVTLQVKDDYIQLTVEDNGSGFFSDPNHRKKGLGVTSMTERIRLVNGTFSLISKPGLGTEVTARIPLVGVHHEADNDLIGR